VTSCAHGLANGRRLAPGPRTTVLGYRESLASVFEADAGGGLAQPTLELVREIGSAGGAAVLWSEGGMGHATGWRWLGDPTKASYCHLLQEAFGGSRTGLHRGHAPRASPTSGTVGFRFWQQHGQPPGRNISMNKLMKFRYRDSVHWPCGRKGIVVPAQICG